MRAALLLMAGLGLLLAGCSRTVSDYSDTAVAPSTPDAQNPACPEVAGTFAIPENSAIGRVLVGRRLHDEGLSMLHIEKQSHSSVYFLRLRPTLEAFNADAAKLAENDPQRYSAWEELNRERLRAITERKSLDVLDDKIGKLGPLSEGRILAGGHGCKEYWLELDIDADAAGRYFPDVDRLGADARYEFGLLLARNADGDLIARFDRYRLRGFDLISKGLRTSRSMYYEKLEAIDYDTFDWQLDMESTPEPEPETVAPRATLAQDIARISQALTELLPENAELTRFRPREVAADAHATGSNAYIDVSGVAARNADVADFMRGLDSLEGVSAVELVSLRATETGRIEFVLVLTVAL